MLVSLSKSVATLFTITMGLNKVLTVPETFMVSSNIGTARMAEAIGTDGIKKFFGELGLMSKPEFEIDEVGGPIVPNPWRESNTLTAAFGHGIAVTPLQLVSAFSAIVNGGVIIKPKLVKKEDNLVEQEDSVRVVSKETSLKMRQLLRLVVSDGTAKKANIPGYMVGGKDWNSR
jgi:cell division protein FtsI (penicillin-binding protein 3)